MKNTLYITVNNYINNEKIKYFTLDMLDNAPEYFWKIPASSSGKYHPSFALGEGGLVRHTLACVVVARELFELYNFDDIEKDTILSSLVLHDLYKNGENELNTKTVFDHPMISYTNILNKVSDYPEIFHIIVEIANNVSSHMGKWRIENPRWNDKTNIILPIPKTEMQKFVHLCDYLASRKNIEIKL